MQTILSLDQVLKQQPGYAAQLEAGIAAGKSWAPEQLEMLRTSLREGTLNPTTVGGMINPNLGELARAVVVDEIGKPLWDQYAIWEMPGAITVPYHAQGGYHIGLIQVARPIVGQKNFSSRETFREWLDNPEKRDYTMSWEVPRGFGLKGEKSRDAALREFREELGSRTKGLILNVEEIGQANPNTAFYSNRGLDTFAILVDPSQVDTVRADPSIKEKIAKAEYRPFAEVRTLMTSPEMFCGLSKAALGMFMAKKFDEIVRSDGYQPSLGRLLRDVPVSPLAE